MKKIILFVFVITALFTVKFAYSDNFDHVFLWQVRASVTEKEIQEIKNYGVTTIQSTRLLDNSDEDIKSYLDLAAKYDLKVIPFLHIFVNRSSTNGCDLSARGKELVNKFSSHKAVYAWHTLDEPVQHDWSKKCQQYLHDFVKSINPKAKVIISTNMFRQEHYDKYFEPNAVDILDLHKYSNPVANWKQEQMLDMYQKNKPTNKEIEIFVTLRAFNAPHRKLRKDLTSNSIATNYKNLFKAKNITDNVGFYGWNLNPNEGIQKSADIKKQFIDTLKIHHERMKNK